MMAILFLEWSYPILGAIPLIHESNALGEDIKSSSKPPILS